MPRLGGGDIAHVMDPDAERLTEQTEAAPVRKRQHRRGDGDDMGTHRARRQGADDDSSRDWSIRTTRQRRERDGAVAAGITGILSIGASLCALLAAGDRGFAEAERVGVLLGGVVAVAVLAVGAIATESLARH